MTCNYIFIKIDNIYIYILYRKYIMSVNKYIKSESDHNSCDCSSFYYKTGLIKNTCKHMRNTFHHILFKNKQVNSTHIRFKNKQVNSTHIRFKNKQVF